jgi:hypothetical protein
MTPKDPPATHKYYSGPGISWGPFFQILGRENLCLRLIYPFPPKEGYPVRGNLPWKT